MNNSLENILSTLLTNSEAEKTSSNPVSNISPTEIKTACENSLRIQSKIDVLRTFLPLVSQKNKEYIDFMIKALTVAKFICDMDTKE